jgi:hypothetical protein
MENDKDQKKDEPKSQLDDSSGSPQEIKKGL